MKQNRDVSIIQHIDAYCKRIEDTAEYFHHDYEMFLNNHIFRDAVSLCVLQIGELTGILTDDFKAYYSEMPWRQIKALRNIVAHKYGTIDAELLWEIMNNDIPALKNYCEQIVSDIRKDDGEGQ